MTVFYRVAVCGFDASERNLLEVFFRLASNRTPRYIAAASLADSDFVIVDADSDEALRAVWAAQRVGSALCIGISLPPRGALASLSRPVDPMNIMGVLDHAVSRQESGNGHVPRETAASALRNGIRAAMPSARARQAAMQKEVLDFRTSSSFSNSVMSGDDVLLDDVLVVDDSPIARRYVQSRLQRLGYQADTADSGEEALERVAQTSYRFVFLDVAMPGMDGFEACRAIKRRPWPIGHEPVVVMVTGRTGAVDRIRAQLAGSDAYLTKPVIEDELMRVLARHDNTFERVFEPTSPLV